MTSEPQGVLDELALSRGYLVASSGLHVNNANVNHTVAAEALAMLKEHVVETYGPIRYTIGAGCSGGAIMQQVIAEQYPGLLDGILPGCSYPDVWTTATEVLDCGILLRYFGSVTEQAGWTEAQKAAVMGTRDTSVCTTGASRSCRRPTPTARRTAAGRRTTRGSTTARRTPAARAAASPTTRSRSGAGGRARCGPTPRRPRATGSRASSPTTPASSTG